MKRYLLLFAIGIVVTAFIPNLTRKTAAAALQDDARVAHVLEFLKANAAAATEEQIRITEIAAPPFHEGARAAYMKKLLTTAGLRVDMDATGNVIGEFTGTSPDIVMLTAHMDTVFPAGTNVAVKREGNRLLAPGISDNGTGLAAMVVIARSFHEMKIKTKNTVLFVADVGEEG